MITLIEKTGRKETERDFMRYWLIALIIAAVGLLLGSRLKREYGVLLAGVLALAAVLLYAYTALFVHHNGLGAGLAVITIWLLSGGVGLLMGALPRKRS